MDENRNEQDDFNRQTASVALELIELVRRQHEQGGLDIDEAFDGISTRDSEVVLAACLGVVDVAIRVGAQGTDDQAYYGRLGVIREAVKDILGRS